MLSVDKVAGLNCQADIQPLLPVSDVSVGLGMQMWHWGVLGLLLLVVVLGIGLAIVLTTTRRQAAMLRELELQRKGSEKLSAQLGLVMQHANDIILIFDADERLIEVNVRAIEQYGYTREELMGMRVQQLREPGTLPDLSRQIALAMTPEGVVFETIHRRKDGSTFPVEVSARRVEILGKPHLFSVVRVIEQRLSQERQIKRLASMYRVQGLISAAIMRARDTRKLFAEICRIVVEDGGFGMAWVGWYDADSGRIRPVASEGDLHGYLEDILITVDEAPTAKGTAGRAYVEGVAQVCNDIEKSSGMDVWKGKARKAGFKSQASIPVRRLGEIVCILSVYALEVDFFGKEEIRLLEEVGLNLSFGLDLLHHEDRRRTAEATLKAREEIFSAIVEQAGDSIVLVDSESLRFLEFNEAACRSLGYTRAEFSQLKVSDINAFIPEADVRGEAKQIINDGVMVFDSQHRCKDGQVRDVRVSAKKLSLHGKTLISAVWSDITERKRAELQLRKLSRAIDQAPVSVVITDLAGRIEYVNPHFTHETGYSFDEVKGQTPRLLKSGKTPEYVYKEMWGMISQGKVWRGELCNRRRNGQFNDELVVIAPVVDDEGRATHYVALKEDITERKHAESSLRAREQTLTAIFDHAETGIAYVGTGGVIVRANTRLVNMLRASAEEVVGMRVDALLPPAEISADSFLMAINEGKLTHHDAEHPCLRRDGSVFRGHVGVSSVRRMDGQPEGYVMVLDDVTDRHEAREMLLKFNSDLENRVALRTSELAERNREIQGLLDAIPDSVFLYGQRGELLLEHRAVGFDAVISTAQLSQPAGKLKWEEVLRDFLKSLAAQEAWVCGIVVREVDLGEGEQARVMELRAVRVGAQGILLVVRDISERRRVEREVQANLERERQLSEMKTRFMSVASHEFRTPLAAAMGTVELLEEHAESISPARRHDMVVRIHRALRRLTLIMENVLTLSRADSGHMPVESRAVHAGQLVREAVSECEAADKGRHAFQMESRGVDPEVHTDPTILHHILSNLLGNAVRYSPEGSRISVDMSRDGGNLCICVGDEGIGVPEEDRHKIFEPFVRGANVGQIAGTGLGLNIARRYAELIGGRLELMPGGPGAVFKLSLPLSEKPMDQATS